MLEHHPQAAHPGRAERLSVRDEVRERHDGRAGVEAERVQPGAHGGGIRVTEAQHDLGLCGRGLGRDELERRNEIDRRAPRGGQLGAKGLGGVAVPADNENAGAGESVVIHTGS